MPANDARERRLASLRASAARQRERLSQLTPLQQAAWKARTTLGEGYDPYTPEEKEMLRRVQDLQKAFEDAAGALHSTLTERYRSLVRQDPRVAVLLAELEAGKATRLDVPIL